MKAGGESSAIALSQKSKQWGTWDKFWEKVERDGFILTVVVLVKFKVSVIKLVVITPGKVVR